MDNSSFLSKYKEQLYAIMRIVMGILFISHGYPKFIELISGAMNINSILQPMAVTIETIGGLMIVIGWKAHWAAFISSGTMAVAYFKVHAFRSFWPIDNGGEKAVFYCFIFLFMAAYGSGIWSVDSLLKSKSK